MRANAAANSSLPARCDVVGTRLRKLVRALPHRPGLALQPCARRHRRWSGGGNSARIRSPRSTTGIARKIAFPGSPERVALAALLVEPLELRSAAA